MFFKRDRDCIDESSSDQINEMDIDVTDETKTFGSRGYFGNEKYTGRRNDHMCKDGHEHESNDRRTSVSPNRPQSDRGYNNSPHMCEEGKGHEHSDKKMNRQYKWMDQSDQGRSLPNIPLNSDDDAADNSRVRQIIDKHIAAIIVYTVLPLILCSVGPALSLGLIYFYIKLIGDSKKTDDGIFMDDESFKNFLARSAFIYAILFTASIIIGIMVK